MIIFNNRDDVILVILLIIIVGLGGFLIFKNNFSAHESIKIDRQRELKREVVNKKRKNKATIEEIFVHIGGAVSNPGVYKVKEGARVYKLLKKAGGATKEANLNAINLAVLVRDGSKIIIPTKLKKNKTGADSNKININLADKTNLKKLKGIGPVTAQEIITYRQQHGRFNNIEELKKVSGIGNRTLAQIRSRVTY
ncbi:competence protein ComEA-like protein with helix-hairpin-helix repeat region [Halobacteroides halobius DSM 5150]|uniref:Competence protein ComEA-like protein with helix-hairpin-helix repeat region n=1 Tax=Halobacteroides halobius (strain ATCC 35273 / DSM 5150 / MD-1) TaxID=748449 RepID=L0KCN5_HALHC|nr:helix-hairpin-helix domain-containing protein [Halobacteroides halobius]AGB41823.1 competence protein ComEA-like protein with helix-hairpin-helix repeat region [Halobacteroides halobius DSM 5150]